MPRPSVEEERRAQILDSACQVIAQRGITELRVADVAKVAGLSPAIIHYYFDSKRELIKAAFAANFADSLERRSGVLNSTASPRVKLRSLIDSYVPEGEPTIRAWHVWIELWAGSLQDADLQDLNQQAYGEWRMIVAQIIDEGQTNGQFRAGDSECLADVVVAALDGLSIQSLAGQMPVERVRAVCSDMVDRLLLPATTSS